MITVHRDSFHQRTCGIASAAFLSAILTVTWIGPLAGFLISVVIGIISIGLREAFRRFPKHHRAIEWLFIAIVLAGAMIISFGYFFFHFPFFLVAFIGIQVAQWMLLFFT